MGGLTVPWHCIGLEVKEITVCEQQGERVTKEELHPMTLCSN